MPGIPAALDKRCAVQWNRSKSVNSTSRFGGASEKRPFPRAIEGDGALNPVFFDAATLVNRIVTPEEVRMAGACAAALPA